MCSSLKFFLKLAEFLETGWPFFAKLRPNLCECRKFMLVLREIVDPVLFEACCFISNGPRFGFRVTGQIASFNPSWVELFAKPIELTDAV